jgi:uncharacterized protein YcgI (DUF1989 family)
MQSEPTPSPAYFPTHADSPLHPPTELYARLRDLGEVKLVKTQDFLIPPRSGKAWTVRAGELWRLSTPAGPQVRVPKCTNQSVRAQPPELSAAVKYPANTPAAKQVGDLNIWNAHDPRERFWAARTRQLQGSHMREGDRLWSCLPFMRPLCGIVADTCALGSRAASHDVRGALTRFGGRCHDLLGTRCDPYVSHMLTATSYDYTCHSNLVRAVAPRGLTEFDVHDVLNVFQVTGLDAQGRYFMEASPATPASGLTLFAEQDLLCALSTCPGGDLSRWGWGHGEEGEGMKETCRPIGVEVWEIREDVCEEVLAGWKRPQRSGYKGCHGMGIPEGEA